MPLRHHSLVAWQRADDLFVELHALTIQAFPSHERFELGSQTRRAPTESPQTSSKDLRETIAESDCSFLNTARGSLAEVGHCIHAAARLGYFTERQRDALEIKVKQAAAPLTPLTPP